MRASARGRASPAAPAEDGAPVDPGQHRDRRGGRLVGHEDADRKEDRDAARAAEARQDADDEARDDPQREDGEDEGGGGDGEAAGELAEGLHQNGSPSVYQMLLGRATRKKLSNTTNRIAGITTADAATQGHR